jgi:muramidase (phage lysozyme)
MGARIGVFTQDRQRYDLEFFAPFNQDYQLIQTIREKHKKFQPAEIDDPIILAVLAELPDCRSSQTCIRAGQLPSH